MPKAAAEKKRPYMASHQRRRALLDVATEIVGRSGWSGLTMKGLASDAGVSRQLVYDHFEDGAGLLLSTIKHLFEGSHRATAEVLQSSTGDVSSTIREAYRIFLEMPAAQRRALRAISGDFVPDRPETRKAVTVMREQIFALWLPYARRQTGLSERELRPMVYARRQTGLSERELRPMVWMLNAASWGLADLVDDGTVSKERATDMLAHFVEQVMVRGRDPRRRRKAATSARSRKRKYAGRGDPHE
jgi:AcrR family transcriptional regulator